MKKEPNKRVHTKFHGSRWKINNCLTIIKRVSMRRQLPTVILKGKVLRSTRTLSHHHTNVSSWFIKSMRPYERNLPMQARQSRRLTVWLPHLSLYSIYGVGWNSMPLAWWFITSCLQNCHKTNGIEC